MTPVRVKVITGKSGWTQLKRSWQTNYPYYLQEGLGLAIFMISACFFGAMLESEHSPVHSIAGPFLRITMMGILMSITALFIFYSPFTARSGAHINPAVTITFYRLGKLCHWDALFYIGFQIAGGVSAVFLMRWLLGDLLTDPPVSSVVTVPGKYGIEAALLMEFSIAFCTMIIVLFSSGHERLKKHTRMIAALLVFAWVVIAGPVSGFGMNPARSLASALPSGIWTASWIYFSVPFIGMLIAAEVFLFVQKTFYSQTINTHK